jgi:cytochrome c oxidase subunit 2
MSTHLRFMTQADSTISGEYNLFFWLMTILCGLVVLGIAGVILYSSWRYRRRSDTELPPQIQGGLKAELTWTIIPLFLFMGMFGWGARLYFELESPPANAMEIYVVAKQWMWKLQHLDGSREINELHIPVGKPIKLVMTSQDVIHSFFIPDFRVKQDVLPGRYTTLWFQANRAGRFHLFCAEYCGTKHSGMIGWIDAMEPSDYAQWVEQGAAEGSMASLGEKMFHQFACANCHHFQGPGTCPNLRGLFGRPVQLKDGSVVTADETYIRESILDPAAKIVAGYDNIMPNFTGQISEEQLTQLIAFIKSISPPPGGEQPSKSGSMPESDTPNGIGSPGSSAITGTRPGVR